LIQRKPDYFGAILDYLRYKTFNHTKYTPYELQQIRIEATFYKLPGLLSKINIIAKITFDSRVSCDFKISEERTSATRLCQGWSIAIATEAASLWYFKIEKCFGYSDRVGFIFADKLQDALTLSFPLSTFGVYLKNKPNTGEQVVHTDKIRCLSINKTLEQPDNGSIIGFMQLGNELTVKVDNQTLGKWSLPFHSMLIPAFGSFHAEAKVSFCEDNIKEPVAALMTTVRTDEITL